MSVETLVRRLATAVRMIVCRGKITALTVGKGIRFVQVKLGSNETTDNIPLVQHYGFASMPDPGCHAVVVFLNGERKEGAAIATNDLRYLPENLQQGDVVIYDKWGNAIHLSQTGISIISNSDLSLQGNNVRLHATQSLKVDCGGNGWVYTSTDRQDYSRGATGAQQDLHAPEVP